MEVVLHQHAEDQILKRKLDRSLVIEVALHPDQIMYNKGLPPVAQSQIEENGKLYLIRVAFRDEGATRIVITAYKTSKISKYWIDE